MQQIGVTEKGDASVNDGWKAWVYEGNPAILITKNPLKLITENKSLFYGKELSGNVILHATVTGMGGWYLEPNVANVDISLNGLKPIVQDRSFNRNRIVIRQDPIFVPELIVGGEKCFEDILGVAVFAKEHRLRYRMSFLDLYPHVVDRLEDWLKKMDMPEHFKELRKLQPDLHLPLKTRQQFLNLLKRKSGLTDEEIEICGEPEMKCTGCISKRDLNTFGIELEKDVRVGYQRPSCACLGLKKELLKCSHPCQHQCMYCYWQD